MMATHKEDQIYVTISPEDDIHARLTDAVCSCARLVLPKNIKDVSMGLISFTITPAYSTPSTVVGYRINAAYIGEES